MATGTETKRRTRRHKVVTTVNLEPAVRSYLDLLMERHDRDRSYIVNALIKRHMRRDLRDPSSDSSGGEVMPFPPPLLEA